MSTTRQLAVRCQGKNGKWHTAILIFNLQDDQLAWLCQPGKRPATLYLRTISGERFTPMTCVVAAWKQPLKAPNKAWESPNETKSP